MRFALRSGLLALALSLLPIAPRASIAVQQPPPAAGAEAQVEAESEAIDSRRWTTGALFILMIAGGTLIASLYVATRLRVRRRQTPPTRSLKPAPRGGRGA